MNIPCGLLLFVCTWIQQFPLLSSSFVILPHYYGTTTTSTTSSSSLFFFTHGPSRQSLPKQQKQHGWCRWSTFIPQQRHQRHQQQQHYVTPQHKEFDKSDVYDLAVIGAGVVGVQAALLASSAPYNKRVVLIDSKTASGALLDGEGQDLSIGGPTGLFSKALRDVSKRIKVSTLRGMGLREDSVWNEILTSCVELAESNAQDIYRQLDYAGVTYLPGFASFPDGGSTTSLMVQRQVQPAQQQQQQQQQNGPGGGGGGSCISSVLTVQAKHVLVATGSSPFRPGGIPFDGQRVFDSDSINTLQYLPKSLVITGSGIIAVEFAKIFRNLGAQVTIVIRDLSPRRALQKIGLDTEYVVFICFVLLLLLLLLCFSLVPCLLLFLLVIVVSLSILGRQTEKTINLVCHCRIQVCHERKIKRNVHTHDLTQHPLCLSPSPSLSSLVFFLLALSSHS